MNGKMRKKASLLSRVSTLAIIAAAGAFGATQQAQAQCTGQLNVDAPGPINADANCAVVDSSLAPGDVTNNANIGPGDGDSGFFVGDGGIINGALRNVDTIRGGTAGGGFDTPTGALTIGEGGDITGGIFNTGQINSENGNGINLGLVGGESSQEAAMTGDITNSAGIQGGIHGIAALRGTMAGTLFNEDGANIIGGDVAVYIDDAFQSWTGGINNACNIAGDNAGIQVGDLLFNGKFVDFSGGITNTSTGTISSLNGPAIIAGGDTFSGGINNAGLITQRSLELAGGEGTYAGVGIVVAADTFNDGITNSGQIDGLGGPAIWITNQTTNFNDGITNQFFGQIVGDEDGILVESDNFNGNLLNGAFAQIIANGGTGAAVRADTEWNGNVDNQGLLQGGEASGYGFFFEGKSFFGNFSNSGTATSGFAGVWFASKFMQIGGPGGVGQSQFTNTNLIQGGEYGFAIIVDGGENSVNVDFANEFGGGENPATPTIETTGEGGGIAGVVLAARHWNGTVDNEGVITGGVYGMILGGAPGDGVDEITVNWQGDITNAAGATIAGGSTGLALFAQNFGGESGSTITNNGTITGDNVGMLVAVTTFNGDIENAGDIVGLDTGMLVNVETFNGTITNTGLIEGGGGETGLHVIADTYNGDIINDGELTAVSNSLHVQVNNLNGEIINDVNGVITADFEQTAVLLEIDDETATFVNRGVIDGNVLLGDDIFSGKAEITFLAESGGIHGDITGAFDDEFLEQGPNDIVLVTGTHYFVEQVEPQGNQLFSHTATNLAEFTIDDGGTALMGATSIGADDGTGYAFDNVGELNVLDGTLYIDNHTVLGDGDGGLGTFTQGKNGRTMFFLLAPEDDESPEVGVHYGQINADTTVTLQGGTISAFLDPTTFTATSLTEVTYEDVITGTTLSGDFTATELFSIDSIWQLAYEINGPGSSAGSNTVDLLVTRTDLSHLGNIGGLVIETSGPFKQAISGWLNGIGSGSCGLAGSGWCFNRYAQADIGAGQVMTDATPGLDPFQWLRTGVRRVGETAAWGRAIGVWGETDGDVGILASDFDLYGGIVGIDYVFTPVLLAGVAAQYTTQDIEFDGVPDNANVDSFEIGGYMSWGDTRLYVNANASVIFHDFEVTRFVGAGQAFGDYDGTTLSAYAEGGKIFETEDGLRIQPLLALSYANLETDAYTETGTALTLLNVFDSEFESLKGMAGARLGYPIAMDSGGRFVPEVRFIYAHEFLDDQSSFTATAGGPPIIVFGEEYSRETFIVGGGFTAPLSQATSVFIDYDAGLNEDVTTHTVSAGLRSRW